MDWNEYVQQVHSIFAKDASAGHFSFKSQKTRSRGEKNCHVQQFNEGNLANAQLIGLSVSDTQRQSNDIVFKMFTVSSVERISPHRSM